jgi:hypothetical protein
MFYLSLQDKFQIQHYNLDIIVKSKIEIYKFFPTILHRILQYHKGDYL